MRVELLAGGNCPTKAHKHDAGYDCFAYEDVIVMPNETVKVRLGFKIEIPSGWVGRIVGRSGLNKQGFFVIEGTIDTGYQGEVGCIIHNASKTPFTINTGDRVAQLVLMQCYLKPLLPTPNMFSDVSERGEGGYGHTGLK